MDHKLELVIPILEILEIEVSNILYNPGNIGNLIFPIFSHPGNVGNLICFFNFPISWKYRQRVGGSRGQAPGGLEPFLEHVSWNFRTSWKYWKSDVYILFMMFPKKTPPRNVTQNRGGPAPRSLI